MTATAAQASALAERLGITKGLVVQELGYDTDTDELIGDAIVAGSGAPGVEEDFEGVVDLVIFWWRDGDGDLGDMLVDAMAPLAPAGLIWLLTPKYGRPGSVEPADIAESAETCGLRRTTSLTLKTWQAIRLVPR